MVRVHIWKNLTEEEIEAKVAPVVTELYGECPEFGAQTIWLCG